MCASADPNPNGKDREKFNPRRGRQLAGRELARAQSSVGQPQRWFHQARPRSNSAVDACQKYKKSRRGPTRRLTDPLKIL